ncbi:MAG: hypothetical protein WC612_02385 [Bdellovibrionales bacterium]|jgi:hypothetical protein
MRKNYHLLKQLSPQPPPMFMGDPLKLNLAAVALVRATNIFPVMDKNGSVFFDTGINGERPKEKGFRNSVHFALNHHVQANNGGDWADAPYVIIAGFEETHRPIQEKMSKAGLADRTMEGIHLGAFNPLDTWFCLGYDAKLELPHAAVVAPQSHDTRTSHTWPKLNDNELFKIEGNRTTYKRTNYTTNDFLSVMEKSAAFMGLLSYNGIEEKTVHEIANLARQETGFKLNTVLRQAGYGSEAIAVLNGILRYQIKDLATIHTMEAKGYPFMRTSGHNWQGVSIDSAEDKTIDKTAHELGAIFGAERYHRHTPYSDLEDSINGLIADTPRDGPARLNGVVTAPNGIQYTHAMRIESALNNRKIDESTRIAALQFLKDRYNVCWDWEDVEGKYRAKLLGPPASAPSLPHNISRHIKGNPAPSA